MVFAEFMTKFIFIISLLTLTLNSSIAQSRQVIDSLLLPLYFITNSENISNAPEAKQIIGYGEKVLPILTIYFADTTKTNIRSDCQNIYITKGEVAIIIADRIEMMPYATLTGIQNCLMEFCKDNPNLIEYYLTAIRRDGVKIFKEKYSNWLMSKDRKKWAPYLTNKKNKKKNS